MPKYGIHHIVLNETIDLLKALPSQSAREAGELLDSQRFYANLGAIGPDLFFFAEDYDFISVIATILPVIKFVEDVEKKVEEVIKPIRDVHEFIGDAVDQTLDTLGLGIVTDIEKRIERIEKLTTELKKMTIAAGMLQGISPLETDTGSNALSSNPFSRLAREWYEVFFIPPSQVNYEEVDWYWFDMLHYRHTGDFARNLVQNAGNDRQKAYALGYLTHIATDVVGHPYVNQIVGGPFRLGVQRHVTAENFMDAHQYREDYDRAVGQTLAADLSMTEATHEDLHDDIAQLLEKTFEDTYGNVVHPLKLAGNGFLSADQIKTAYELLRRTLNVMGAQKDLKPVPPLSTADEDLADVIAAINGFDPPPMPPAFVPGMPDFDMESFFSGEISLTDIAAAVGAVGLSFEEWFDAWMGYLAEAVQYYIETALQLLKLLRDLVKLTANTMGRPILILLYGVELALYELFRIAKKIVSLNGFIYPDPDDMDDAVSRSLMSVFDEDLHFVYEPGVPASRQRRGFPKVRASGQSHLLAPQYQVECQHTLPSFHHPTMEEDVVMPALPDEFIREVAFSEENLIAYAQAASPAETRDLQDEGRVIGNAVEFGAWLIEKANGPVDQQLEKSVFTNWNLDGDRGYGAKSWAGLLPHNRDNSVMGQLSIVQAADSGAFSFSPDVIDPNGVISLQDSLLGIQIECQREDDESDYTFAKIKAKDEVYENGRFTSALRVSNLILSEYNIPALYSRLLTRDPDIWASILAPRLLVDGDSMRSNLYHVNGVGTPAYDAFYERYNLEYFFRMDNGDPLRIKLLYNFTDDRLLNDTVALADGLQAAQDKLWSYAFLAREFGVQVLEDLHDRMQGGVMTSSNPEMVQIQNATTIAVIALLYDAFRNQKQLGLMGYSHGTQILFNGIVAFAFQGDEERSFLRDFVRVFFIGRMVDVQSVEFLSPLVNGFDQITNPGDPVSDVIGNFPPSLDFLDSLSGLQINVSLTDASVKSALTDFAVAVNAEEHKFYRYVPRIKFDSPSFQDFF
jgi:hypothetical protein